MSQTVNVLRYSALALGALVGLRHDLFLRKDATLRQEEDQFQTQTKLVAEAKREWARLHPVKTTESAAVNLDDPNVDFAQVILGAVESMKQ